MVERRYLQPLCWLFLVLIALPAGAGSEEQQPGQKPGLPMVIIDNSSADEWTVWVDGTKRATMGPFRILRLEWQPGKHQVRILRGQDPVDQIEVTLREGTRTVLNPGKTGEYLQETATYSEFRDGTMKETRVSGVNVIELNGEDHDLLDVDLPSAIVVNNPKGPYTELKKLYRVAPQDFSVALASVMLADHPRAYRRSALENALKKLQAMPHSAEIREVYLKILDSDNPFVVRHAIEMLETYATEIPDDRLISWVMTPLPQTTSGEAETQQKRIPLAIRVLAMTGKTDILRGRYDQIPDPNWRLLHRQIGVDPNAKVADIGPALEGYSSRLYLEKLLDKSQISALELDEKIVQEMEAHIEKQSDEKSRQIWRDKLGQALPERLKGRKDAWALGRLVGIVQQPGPGAFQALKALIDGGEAKRLVDLLPQLGNALAFQVLSMARERDEAGLFVSSLKGAKPEIRGAAVGAAMGHSEKIVSEGNIPLALELLRGRDNSQASGEICRVLCVKGAVKDPEVRKVVEKAIEEETHAATKEEMKKYLARVDMDKADKEQTQGRESFQELIKKGELKISEKEVKELEARIDEDPNPNWRKSLHSDLDRFVLDKLGDAKEEWISGWLVGCVERGGGFRAIKALVDRGETKSLITLLPKLGNEDAFKLLAEVMNSHQSGLFVPAIEQAETPARSAAVKAAISRGSIIASEGNIAMAFELLHEPDKKTRKQIFSILCQSDAIKKTEVRARLKKVIDEEGDPTTQGQMKTILEDSLLREERKGQAAKGSKSPAKPATPKTPLKDEKPAPAPGARTAEQKAQSLLKMAENLAANKAVDKAIEKAREIVEKYPDTESAREAANLIEKWKAGTAAKSPPSQ